MPRGPKRKTAHNRPQPPSRAIGLSEIEPTSPLNDNAMVEFHRLLEVLDNRGQLERSDLGVVTAAARAKDLVDRTAIAGSVNEICQAENVYLGRLRALALTQIPSRSIVKTIAKDPEKSADPIAGKIKLHA